MDNNRATGRTYRRLLTCLLAASEGKKVAYVCNTYRNAEWCFGRATKLTPYGACVFTSDQRKIEFPNGGWVKFTSSEWVRREAMQVHMVITDD